jgi:hypothetical protein
MAVNTGVAKQALGFVEEKLRRVFNLAGPIDASLDPQVKPVIIVDDLRAPGHAFFAGRSWVWNHSESGILAGVKATFVKCLNDVMIEGWWAHFPAMTAGTQNFGLYLLTPDQMTASPPFAAALNVGAWRDRRMTDTDQPPFAGSTAFGGITGSGSTGRSEVYSSRFTGTPAPGYMPVQMFVPAGGGIAFFETDMTCINCGVHGRVWPQ